MICYLSSLEYHYHTAGHFGD